MQIEEVGRLLQSGVKNKEQLQKMHEANNVLVKDLQNKKRQYMEPAEDEVDMELVKKILQRIIQTIQRKKKDLKLI